MNDRFPAGQHLVQAHDQLRHELTELRELIARIEAGTIDAGRARSHLAAMTLRQNNWTLGAYCESYCRVLTIHHTREDSAVFPHLRRSAAALAPALDRLEEEHRAIHGVIERLDRTLVAFIAAPQDVKELRAAFEQLADTLLAHLSYEESVLVEPLSLYGHGST
jgi:hemerythrin-like domain-containing protein